MKEEKIREAFSRIKEDIVDLKSESRDLKEFIKEVYRLLKKIDEEVVMLRLDAIAKKVDSSFFNGSPDLRGLTGNSTHNLNNSTHPVTSTDNSTVPQEIGGWNTSNSNISIGNEGVSTDRQTDRQTVRQTDFMPEKPSLVTTNQVVYPAISQPVVTNISSEKFTEKPIKNQISEASEILDSLDNIKKEIRKKFKSITHQEMLVFSTIYSMEESEDPDYGKLAQKLNLSQSSIRDYVQRMINKGIPIDKEKLNNKKILLHISPDLKKIATLDTIMRLRSL